MKKWIRKLNKKQGLSPLLRRQIILEEERRKMRRQIYNLTRECKISSDNAKFFDRLYNDVKSQNSELRDKITRYERYNVIPKSLFIELLNILPDPTEFKGSPEIKFDKKIRVANDKIMPYIVNVHVVKVTDEYLSISVNELGILISIRCVLHEDNYDFIGHRVNATVWHWNWSEAGLTIISDTDYYLITEFLKSQNIVSEAFS